MSLLSGLWHRKENKGSHDKPKKKFEVGEERHKNGDKEKESEEGVVMYKREQRDASVWSPMELQVPVMHNHH